MADQSSLQALLVVSQLPGASKHLSVLRSRLDSLPSLLKSFWLFTASDLKTIVGPCTAFAILQQLGSSSFNSEQVPITSSAMMVQVLKVICWTWINLLPFNIDNQRRSIDEDALNKPWRPLPAGRITSEQATAVMMVLYPIAILFGIFTGAHIESFVLVALGIWYNDLGGANASWIMRNFINACGITCFLSGSLSVMLHNQYHGSHVSQSLFDNPVLRNWVAIIGAIIFCGIQTQDMYDQVGDRLLDRKTMPLVLGDALTRRTIAFPVMFWSWVCPYMWSLPTAAYIVPVALGAIVARRTLTKRTVKDDKMTSKLWNLWLVVFFTLPLQQACLV